MDASDFVEMVPVRRWGRVWDIGFACVFLASEAGTFISGDTLVVDGGNWLWKPAMAPKEMVQQLR
jgi:peroxisomal 2,4-dienoyl-CoA reductase